MMHRMNINNPWEPSANDADEKKNVWFDSMVVSVIAVEHQITLETEGSTVNTLLIDIVEVDSEDEREKTANHQALNASIKSLKDVITPQNRHLNLHNLFGGKQHFIRNHLISKFCTNGVGCQIPISIHFIY
ncbi:hypothetical protein MKX03_012646 [Papaver bracteatum]|nr:hypothetical protein MKX03_012646 [Papaver bracteatum]